MWQRFAKRFIKNNNKKAKASTTTAAPSSSSTSSSSPFSPFSHTSFKDTQHLITEDQDDLLNPLSPTRTTTRKSAVFHRTCLCISLLFSFSSFSPSPSTLSFPGANKRIIVYTTSLRVVRSTFEQCQTVRKIQGGLCVSVEERDVVMDSAFFRELSSVLGVPYSRISLPKVFIGGKYIGGANEIQHLN